MKAIVSKRFGSADKLELADVQKPAPGPGEALVRIHATSITRGDVVLRKMPKLVTRLFGETPKSILGHEYAGVVEALGEETAGLAVGDRVFGTTSGLAQGSHAEYVAVPADGIVATLPASIGFAEAAPVPVGAMTALHFLHDAGVRDGTSVLVNGASGSVGTYAVQIASHLGAKVTAVCGPSNVEMVHSLGADEVIDYTEQDLTELDRTFDVVFDAVAKTSAKKVQRVLADGGRFVTTRTRRDERVEELAAIRDMLGAGSIRAVVDRTYTLDQVPDAHRYVERGHKRGNVLVTVVE